MPTLRDQLTALDWSHEGYIYFDDTTTNQNPPSALELQAYPLIQRVKEATTLPIYEDDVARQLVTRWLDGPASPSLARWPNSEVSYDDQALLVQWLLRRIEMFENIAPPLPSSWLPPTYEAFRMSTRVHPWSSRGREIEYDIMPNIIEELVTLNMPRRKHLFRPIAVKP
ncbi:hypothetical protein BN946_scf185011.g41 [Trametes cinnabarina]|uniref:Uncharacterized protein n=1 Tax=Pycnoporus cinnabarinus TaxID=5643 RepID=A0A060SPC4_PYCCI|nr:hypothetical protein BN946_scf185011.g41 [Trametes cinnabarina]